MACSRTWGPLHWRTHTCHRSRSTAWSPSTRCAHWSAAGASWCSSRSSRRPSGSSPSTPTSPPTPRAGWSTARSYAEQMIERLGLDRESHVVEIASNDGYLLQFFHERQIPVLGIEPAANVAKVALAEGHSDAGGVLRARHGAVAGRDLGRRPAARQQRARARPRPERLRRRHEDPAGAGRRDHDGVSPSDAPDRGQPVGHDLPRALLLLLLPHRQPRVRGARLASVRRRGAAHARRIAAHLWGPCRGSRASPRARRRASCASASGRPATRSSTPTSAMAAGSRRTSARSSAF